MLLILRRLMVPPRMRPSNRGGLRLTISAFAAVVL